LVLLSAHFVVMGPSFHVCPSLHQIRLAQLICLTLVIVLLVLQRHRVLVTAFGRVVPDPFLRSLHCACSRTHTSMSTRRALAVRCSTPDRTTAPLQRCPCVPAPLPCLWSCPCPNYYVPHRPTLALFRRHGRVPDFPCPLIATLLFVLYRSPLLGSSLAPTVSTDPHCSCLLLLGLHGLLYSVLRCPRGEPSLSIAPTTAAPLLRRHYHCVICARCSFTFRTPACRQYRSHGGSGLPSRSILTSESPRQPQAPYSFVKVLVHRSTSPKPVLGWIHSHGPSLSLVPISPHLLAIVRVTLTKHHRECCF